MYAARPIGDRLLVKVQERNDGRVWLPAGHSSTAQRGIVLSAGDDVRHVNTGDVILFAQEYALEVPVEGDRLTLVPETNVLLVIETDEVPA